MVKNNVLYKNYNIDCIVILLIFLIEKIIYTSGNNNIILCEKIESEFPNFNIKLTKKFIYLSIIYKNNFNYKLTC